MVSEKGKLHLEKLRAAENPILQKLRNLSRKLEPPVELSAHHELEFFTETEMLLPLTAAGTIMVLEATNAAQAGEIEGLREVLVRLRQSTSYILKQLQRPSSEQDDAWNYIGLGVDELYILLGMASEATEFAVAHQHDDDDMISAGEASDLIKKAIEEN